MGPVREIHAGAGYWSQDDNVQVMTYRGIPHRLWVQWPGGKEETYTIPETVRELTISRGQKLRTR